MGYKGKLAVLLAAQAVGLLAVALLVYRPNIAAIDKAEENLTELSRNQADLCRLVKASPNPDAETAHAKAEMRRLDNRLPPESRVSWLSARIADALRANDIDLRSASRWAEAGKAPGTGELKRMRRTMTLRCPAKDLQAFLESLNKLPFAVVVDDLSVERRQNSGTVSANIKLATFVLRARPGASKTGSESP